MAPFAIGQKRKALGAFESCVKIISRAGELAASEDYEAALSHYDRAIESLRSNACKRAVSDKSITDSAWAEQICAALLGKARALAAKERQQVAFAEMERMMAEAFALKPDWPEARDFMAELAISQGCVQSAQHHLDHLLKSEPHNQRGRFLLALIDFHNRAYDEALHKLASLPDSMPSLCYAARCYLKTGRFDAAIETLERARLRFGESYECDYYLGCALGHANRLEEARGVLGQLSRWIGRRAEPIIQLGILYLISGWLDAAEQSFKAALKLGPRDPLPAYYGLALTAMNDTRRFKTHIESLQRIAPESDSLHCALGCHYESVGMIEQAEREYEAVSATGEMAGAALTRLGFMLYRKGEFARALEKLREASRLRPRDHRLLNAFAASAALTGDYRLAVEVWSGLPARRRADEKTSRALRSARLGLVAESLARKATREAIEQLDEFHKETNDAAFGQLLTELYFIEAVYALNLAPPDVAAARQHLSLGKLLSKHPKLEYCLALADLIEGDDQAAVARLREVLAANAKNPGASYHLGLGLLRAGDETGAENAFRHGIAVSFNQPSKLRRLKWALALMLASKHQWADAARALDDFAASDEADPATVEAVELQIRCLAMCGGWEAAERAALSLPREKQTALSAAILTWKIIKSGDLIAALSQVENYFALNKDCDAAASGLTEKSKDALAVLSLKVAAELAQDGKFHEAETVLRRVSSLLTPSNCSPDRFTHLEEFIAALHNDARPEINRLAQRCRSLDFKPLFDLDDIRPQEAEIPIIVPLASQEAAELIEQPEFEPGDWGAAPYPDPLIIFDS